jgi:hypothetical protein
MSLVYVRSIPFDVAAQPNTYRSPSRSCLYQFTASCVAEHRPIVALIRSKSFAPTAQE